MSLPKSTDPEELKKREELSKRLKEYPNEELKKALEWIQAKKEQEERGSIIIEILEKLWEFSYWKFIFNEGVKKDDGNWKYIEIDGKKYYEWSEGMNWFWYRCSSERARHYYFLCWEFKDGHILRWIQIFHSWDKYVGQFKNDVRDWQWTYTCINWNILTWVWKNGFISEGKMKLASDGTEIDVIWDRDNWSWKVTTEWKYKDKHINHTTWEFIEP